MNPQEGERHFLRNASSTFKRSKIGGDIRAVDGEVCNSFCQACSRRGLLADDTEWRRALRESFSSEFVPLSHIFATILAYFEPSYPLPLWTEHKSLFVSDIRLRHRGRATAYGMRKLTLSYVLFEFQESLKLIAIFNLKTF